MPSIANIEHDGHIIREDKKNYYIQIVSKSACAECHSKGVCSAADIQDKIIDVNKMPRDEYKVGDKIIVSLERSAGKRAVVFAYFIPSVILVGSLVLILKLGGSEGLAALVSVGSLIPYYLILFSLKDKIKGKYNFKIRRRMTEEDKINISGAAE